MKRDFGNWTSGNARLDKFIQQAQITATVQDQLFEWVPFDKLCDVKRLAKGGTGTVYTAKHLGEFKRGWNAESEKWDTFHPPNGIFVLKSIPDSDNISEEMLNEVRIGCNAIVVSFVTISRNLTQILDQSRYNMRNLGNKPLLRNNPTSRLQRLPYNNGLRKRW